MGAAVEPEAYRTLYSEASLRNALVGPASPRAAARSTRGTAHRPTSRSPLTSCRSGWNPQAPRDVRGARALAIFGDSVTTDHISPAGAIKPDVARRASTCSRTGVTAEDFNSYGARRGNHEVMVRGTFANVRIKNLMVPGVEGGVTIHQPERRAAWRSTMRRCEYAKEGVPLVVIAGQEYGTGSSRDWAAKGHAPARRPRGRGARASSASTAPTSSAWASCRASSTTGMSAETLRLDGTETFDLARRRSGGSRRGSGRSSSSIAPTGATETVPVTLRDRHADRGRSTTATAASFRTCCEKLIRRGYRGSRVWSLARDHRAVTVGDFLFLWSPARPSRRRLGRGLPWGPLALLLECPARPLITLGPPHQRGREMVPRRARDADGRVEPGSKVRLGDVKGDGARPGRGPSSPGPERSPARARPPPRGRTRSSARPPCLAIRASSPCCRAWGGDRPAARVPRHESRGDARRARAAGPHRSAYSGRTPRRGLPLAPGGGAPARACTARWRRGSRPARPSPRPRPVAPEPPSSPRTRSRGALSTAIATPARKRPAIK